MSGGLILFAVFIYPRYAKWQMHNRTKGGKKRELDNATPVFVHYGYTTGLRYTLHGATAAQRDRPKPKRLLVYFSVGLWPCMYAFVLHCRHETYHGRTDWARNGMARAMYGGNVERVALFAELFGVFEWSYKIVLLL